MHSENGVEAAAARREAEAVLRLVVNGDDFGYCASRDSSIIVLATEHSRLVRSASLIVTGASAASAARRAGRVGLSLGLHLNLTEGAPLTECPSLTVTPSSGLRHTDDGPCLEMLGKAGFLSAIDQCSIEWAEVVRETTAQLRRFHKLTGYKATHVDGHQHVLTAVEVARVLAPVLRREGVKTVRVPTHWCSCTRSCGDHGGTAVEADGRACTNCSEHCRGTLSPFLQRVAREAAEARAVFEAEGVASTSAFMGLGLMGLQSSPDRVRAALQSIAGHAPGTASVEWMVHPGYADVAAGDDFNRSDERLHEHSLLLEVSRQLSSGAAVSGATESSATESKGEEKAMEAVECDGVEHTLRKCSWEERAIKQCAEFIGSTYHVCSWKEIGASARDQQ